MHIYIYMCVCACVHHLYIYIYHYNIYIYVCVCLLLLLYIILYLYIIFARVQAGKIEPVPPFSARLILSQLWAPVSSEASTASEIELLGLQGGSLNTSHYIKANRDKPTFYSRHQHLKCLVLQPPPL